MAAQKLTEGSDIWSGFLGFDDYVLGLGGTDVMGGDGGNDRLYGGAGADFILGGDGDDILDGGDDLQLVAVDSDNSSDHLFGEAGNDTLRGKAGDDVLDGGIGKDNLYGGEGRDTLFSTSQHVAGPVPTPTIVVESFADMKRTDVGGVMDGGSGNDTIVSSHDFSGTMTVIGGSGTDTLAFGNDVNAWLDATPYVNTVDLATQSGTTVFNSTLVVREIENIDGDFHNDVFRGDSNANVLRGFGGNDRLEGRGGADTLDGGSGIDVVQYASSLGGVDVDLTRAIQSGNDAQGDVLIGIEEVDGSQYGDTLRGNSLVNYLFGSGGADRLEGRGGADTLNGGSGYDTASYESSSAAVWVSLDEPTTGAAALAAGGDATGDTLISIENLVGSAFADALTGNSLGNRLEGGGGADNLNGGGGDDILRGGDGNDTIFGGQQSDLIDGGFGNDTLNGERDVDTVSFESWDPTGIFTQFGETIRITLGEGTASGTATRTLSVNGVTSVAETDTLTGFENVRGSNRAETITGNSGANLLEGRGGNDILEGKLGSDTLDGGAGVDTATYEQNSGRVIVTLRDEADGSAVEHVTAGLLTFVASTDTLRNIENVRGTAYNDNITGNSESNRLSGGAGNDNIFGGDGNDTLIGGADTNIDRLTGGAGFDTFLFLNRDDSRVTATRTGDAIQDFNVNEDLIDLRALNLGAADLLIQNRVIDGVNFANVTEDAYNNGFLDNGEFSVLVRTDGISSVTAQDVLL
jgi:Ca2+-binding RTX toxin-like protein